MGQLTEKELIQLGKDILKEYPTQPKVYVTKDGNVFLSENLNAAELHAKSIGSVKDIITVENDAPTTSEDLSDTDEEDDLGGGDGEKSIDEMSASELKEYLKGKEVTFKGNASKAELVELAKAASTSNQEGE
jgi:hypothetical protein